MNTRNILPSMTPVAIVSLILLLLASCASGKTKYSPPKIGDYDVITTKIVKKSYDRAWTGIVEEITTKSYSVDNIDKNSGYISITFSTTSPQQYLDCGLYNVKFKNLRGSQDLTFNGADSSQRYTAYDRGNMMPITRVAALNGKISLFLKKENNKSSKLQVSAKYHLQIRGTTGYINDSYTWSHRPYAYIVDLVSGERGFSTTMNRRPVCISNGKLEKEILDLLP